ncbi:MAG: DUF4838 domain-containing protein, partial [Candidatus Hydrogenedens sp.]|nr:DUF4838 domain-containing protein [Candidatus Hydrogenedens sp.]
LLPPVKDQAVDDGVYIDVEGGRGVVTGTNPRSVLLAAYRLLRENGCAFLRPGQDGERVPQKSIGDISAHVCEAAASRHRGVCIEGAVSYQHVLNMIEFLPKVGMNAYYTQFFVPRLFFARWYEHIGNPQAEPRTLTREEAAGLQAALIREIKKRGLMYHAVGHGWTCEPFGVPGDSWLPLENVPESYEAFTAEVNGKRGLWHGVGVNTNLCYGNPEVRKRVTDAIADYCAAHPEVDYLHFWLADSTNNHCECPLCRDTLPSDLYVKMLNELDEKMTARGIPTRVVFLIYVDLLWEPQKEKIRNQDRFVLMFAPITRSYSATMADAADFHGELEPYRRNGNKMTHSVAENVERLRKWQTNFRGDSFDFDYHFMWDHFRDLGYYQMARLLMEDMKGLSKVGLNGMISCQCQRVFFPTGLGMHAMAAGLWDKNADFDALAAWYFENAFGADADAVHGYLRQVSECIDPVYLRGEKEAVDPAVADGYRALEALVDAFEPVIRQKIDAGADANWRALLPHAG